MKVYAVYCHDYSGDSAIEVYPSEEKMQEAIQKDMAYVEKALKEDRYDTRRAESGGGHEVYVDNGIYYSWEEFESELKEDN